jgi:hypothetical protein
VPAGLLVWGALEGELSANPIKDITEETGIWTLRFILFTLTITPLRKISGWAPIARFRRMLGLFAFFYGSLHFATYIYLDQFFAFDEILRDVAKRPFITVGFAVDGITRLPPKRIVKWMGKEVNYSINWSIMHWGNSLSLAGETDTKGTIMRRVLAILWISTVGLLTSRRIAEKSVQQAKAIWRSLKQQFMQLSDLAVWWHRPDLAH